MFSDKCPICNVAFGCGSEFRDVSGFTDEYINISCIEGCQRYTMQFDLISIRWVLFRGEVVSFEEKSVQRWTSFGDGKWRLYSANGKFISVFPKNINVYKLSIERFRKLLLLV